MSGCHARRARTEPPMVNDPRVSLRDAPNKPSRRSHPWIGGVRSLADAAFFCSPIQGALIHGTYSGCPWGGVAGDGAAGVGVAGAEAACVRARWAVSVQPIAATTVSTMADHWAAVSASPSITKAIIAVSAGSMLVITP